MKNLSILKVKETNSMPEFIEFWKRLYDYSNKGYEDIIQKSEYDKDDLIKLFEWKNGMILSGKKAGSLEKKIIGRLDAINDYKKHGSKSDAMLRDFTDVAAVWRIFLFHIIDPSRFPIYDQHIHRAYQFIHGNKWDDIKSTTSDTVKIDFYRDQYIAWFNMHKPAKAKDLDDALFAFGQFLNYKRNRLLFRGL